MLVDPTLDPELYPFTSRWFDSTAGRMHFIDEGAGPPIVFCHGSPTWSFLFRKQVAGLRDQFRCIAVDHLGFGLSERPASGFGYTIAEHTGILGELLDHLDLRDLILVGHDWGGPIGLGAATRRADRIAGLVLTNTTYWPVDPLINRIFSALMSTRAMQRRILERNLLVEQVLLGRAGPGLDDDVADHYRRVQPPGARQALAVAPREIRDARNLLQVLADDVSRHFASTPTVAVWGMRDRVFPPAMFLPRMLDTFDDLDVITADTAGHFVAEEAPDVLTSAIAQRFS